MLSRRQMLGASGAISTAVAASAVSRVAMAALPEPVLQTQPDTMPPLVPNSGRPYNAGGHAQRLDLPWRMNAGVKEFHLVAEPVVREMAPGMKAHLWGYNGQSPGPTIEVVEGDRVRIFVTNKLPEHTSVHWHGQRLPNGMDGVSGLTQPAIPVGQDLRLRVRRAPPRHLHVPPARRRDDADGDGHDGLLGHAPEGQAPADRRGATATSASCSTPTTSTRQRHAEDHDHARLQPVELEQPHLSRHRLAERAPGRQGAHPHRQPDDDQPPDPPARPRVRGHRHRRRADAQELALARGDDRHRGRARCGRSSSSPTRQATGPSTATRATTR